MVNKSDNGRGRMPAACFRGLLFFFSLSLCAGLFPVAAKAATVEEIALYKKTDRQKFLEQGARKEGKLTWYSTLIVDQLVRPVKAAFEKEYPFIQVEFFRGNTERVVQKAVSEYQAKDTTWISSMARPRPR